MGKRNNKSLRKSGGGKQLNASVTKSGGRKKAPRKSNIENSFNISALSLSRVSTPKAGSKRLKKKLLAMAKKSGGGGRLLNASTRASRKRKTLGQNNPIEPSDPIERSDPPDPGDHAGPSSGSGSGSSAPPAKRARLPAGNSHRKQSSDLGLLFRNDHHVAQSFGGISSPPSFEDSVVEVLINGASVSEEAASETVTATSGTVAVASRTVAAASGTVATASGTVAAAAGGSGSSPASSVTSRKQKTLGQNNPSDPPDPGDHAGPSSVSGSGSGVPPAKRARLPAGNSFRKQSSDLGLLFRNDHHVGSISSLPSFEGSVVEVLINGASVSEEAPSGTIAAASGAVTGAAGGSDVGSSPASSVTSASIILIDDSSDSEGEAGELGSTRLDLGEVGEVGSTLLDLGEDMLSLTAPGKVCTKRCTSKHFFVSVAKYQTRDVKKNRGNM
jgi:hypothetical protein